MNKNELRELLETTPLEELGPELDILAERCYQARVANKGRVPREIFESCVGIGGNYPCAQIIVEVIDDTGVHIGYALRQRDAGESGSEWSGLYHNVCSAIRMGETEQDVLARNFADITGVVPAVNDLEYVGTNLQSEPERRADAVTTIWMIPMREADISTLNGTWKVFGDDELGDPSIIDHMQAILRWANDPNRDQFKRTFTKTR